MSVALQQAGFSMLLRLASPSLPIGGFSYSEGLEAAVNAGLVTDETSACVWLRDQLHLSLARSDLPAMRLALLARAQNDSSTVQRIDDWVRESRETAELRLQTEQMGKSLCLWLAERSGHAQPPCTHPVAFALAAAFARADELSAMHAFGHAWCENMVAAAVRSVPLGQNAGQRVMDALLTELPEAIQHAQGVAEDELQSFTPMLAILSAQHEHQYSRLFRS